MARKSPGVFILYSPHCGDQIPDKKELSEGRRKGRMKGQMEGGKEIRKEREGEGREGGRGKPTSLLMWAGRWWGA